MSHPDSDFPSTHPSLIEGIAQWQKDSWDMFFRRYNPCIQKWCKRHRLSDEQCEELSHAILVDMPCKIGTYQFQKDDGTRNRFRAWLKVVVRNRVIDYLRERNRRTADFALGGHDFDSWLSQEVDQLEDELLRANLQDVLEARNRVQARVARDTWTAYELVRVQQYPPQEVAKMLEKPVVSIYTAIHRIHKALVQEYHLLLNNRLGVEGSDHDDGLPGSRMPPSPD